MLIPVNSPLWVALGLYLLACVVASHRPAWGRHVLTAGLVVHTSATIARGWAIGFFPLTNKFESFSAAALAIALVCRLSWQDRRAYDLALAALAAGTLLGALQFPGEITFAPPLMYTIWYPLHVPLSFLSYALWAAAAVAGVLWFFDRRASDLARIDRLALMGFGLWSLSMICGGIWGVLAWGAYFLWDPKVVWSVVLWFHYAAYVHARLTPSLMPRPWVRPALAVVGFAWVIVAYVGTSFFFGDSSHAF